MTGAHRFFASGLLAGRVAVVTGGSTGIGLAIAEALAGAGADVVIAARSADRLAEAELALAERTGRMCAGLPCDVREPDDVARLGDFVRSRFGPATIVVNNAAANFLMSAKRMTERGLRVVLETDLMGTFHVTKEFLPDLIDGESAAVASIGIAAVERGFPGYSHAAAAKAAISSLTCSWAREWGPYGIRVNSVAPGPVPTPGVLAHMLGQSVDRPDDLFAEARRVAPLQRLGTPDDVAAAVVFLCSDAAGWITGVNLTIDGGINLPLGASPDQLA
jgi:NAD(P)-dependent dehydrogenase (short-subunit alcohol dehydrogenase family)